MKQCWRGSFNFHRQIEVLYCYAFSKKQAWAIFCRRLARKHDVPQGDVFNMFNDKVDNYDITKEIEFKEVI